MKLLLNDQIDRNHWNELCAKSAYHRFEWLDIISKAYGLEPLFTLAESDDKFALLPLFRSGSKAISLPYLSYSGFWSNSPELENEIRNYWNQKNQELDIRQPRPDVSPSPVYVGSRSDVGDYETFWNSLASKMRNQIRKSQNSGFSVRIENHIDSFYPIFSRSMHTHGTPVHAKKFFKLILEAFPEDAGVLTIFDGPTPVASMFFMLDSETCYDMWAATAPEYNDRYANYFLYYSIIEFLRGKNRRILDMGRSTYNSSVYNFKQKFRPQNYSITSQINYNKSKLTTVSKLWKYLPYQVTLAVGPPLRKYLP